MKQILLICIVLCNIASVCTHTKLTKLLLRNYTAQNSLHVTSENGRLFVPWFGYIITFDAETKIDELSTGAAKNTGKEQTDLYASLLDKKRDLGRIIALAQRAPIRQKQA